MKLSSKTLIANAALLILLTSFTAFIFLSSRYEEELREDSTQRIQEMNTFMKTLQGYSDTIAHNLLAFTINRDPSSIITIQEAEANLDCEDRKSTRLNSSHDQISYAVFCLKKKIIKIFYNCDRIHL